LVVNKEDDEEDEDEEEEDEEEDGSETGESMTSSLLVLERTSRLKITSVHQTMRSEEEDKERAREKKG